MRLEQALGNVAALVEDLDITLAKLARMEIGGKGGLARERDGFHQGASLAADYLENTLTTWARDVAGDPAVWPTEVGERSATVVAAYALLSSIPDVRKHPAAKDLLEEVTSAVAQAWGAVDRPANRTTIFVGPCPEVDEEGAHCPGEVYAFIPTEDDRPGRMQCRADPVHRWSSVQFYRAGKRILDRQQQIKNLGKSA